MPGLPRCGFRPTFAYPLPTHTGPACLAMQTALRSAQMFLQTYQVRRLLGTGGMGQIFLGENIHTRKPVAIKVMHPHLAQDRLARRRFSSERELLEKFRHPYAVALLDADTECSDPPFLVQEYVEGLTLELQVTHGRLSLDRTTRITGQLCQLLHAMHGKGILHRDISAANVMVVSPGAPGEHIKVMDFGLASLGASAGVYLALDKLAGSENSIGGGTPDYLCPEQIRKEPVDERGDLYSLGVLIFQMLTGELPFGEARSVPEILHAHTHQKPPLEKLLNGGVPARVATFISRLLAKHPAERPASAREAADLFSAAVGYSIADAAGFQSQLSMLETLEGPCCDDLDILDRFDAWMPEQIAVMKLRGFLQEVGGEVVSSLPGKIQVRILDPRVKPQLKKGGLLGFLGFGRPTLSQPTYLHLELLMERHEREGRSLVEFAVVLESSGNESSDDAAMRRGFAERICRELRAYLMV